MLNPVFSFCVYLVEMIISYIFYGSVFESRFTPVKRLLIGGLLFSLGSGVNILFHNNVIINHKVIFDYLFKSSYMPV